MSDPTCKMRSVNAESFTPDQPWEGERRGIRVASQKNKNEAVGKQQVHLGANLPSRSLADAMKVPKAIMDNFAGAPTPPHQIALAVGMSPTSSGVSRPRLKLVEAAPA